MRLVALSDLKGDEIAGRHIIDINGRVLLSKGMRIKLSYLNKLEKLDISGIYVEDKISEGIEIEDVLCEETRLKARSMVHNEMQKYLRTKEVNTYEIQKMVENIIQEVLSNKTNLINLKDLKIKDEYTFSHSVNVCVLSVLLCTKLKFEKEKIQSIGVGCLMHDFGKILIPVEILNKPGKLTNEEYDEIKNHSMYGYKALKDDVRVNPITKVVILTHHERIDGSGYPHGFKGDKIHESAKICSICDVFDAMISDRPYRKGLGISDVVEYLYCTAGIYFDKNFVQTFLECIPIYPTGTVVMLNTGSIGIVVRNNKVNLSRPVVRLLYNPQTRTKHSGQEVNLLEDLTLKISCETKFNREEFNSL